MRDVLADPEYALQTFQKKDIYRTQLGVPLLRNDFGDRRNRFDAHGCESRYTDKQIDLVTTFADQAVIAIENVRLFEEVQERTKELSDALDQQIRRLHRFYRLLAAPRLT